MNIEKMLEYSRDEEKLLIIYPNGSENQHFAGIVEFMTEEHVLLRCVNSDGFKDGYDVFRKEDILYMSLDDKYAQRLNKIISYRKLKFGDRLISNLNNKNINMFFWICELAKKNNKLLSIYTFIDEHNIVSRVVDVSEESVIAQVYDYYGMSNGMREIRYEEIDNIFYDTIVENVEEILIK